MTEGRITVKEENKDMAEAAANIFVMDEMDLPDENKGQKSKYPFETMTVGQVFFLPGRKAGKFSPYAQKFARRFGHRYQIRDVAMKAVMRGDKQVGWTMANPTDDEAVIGCATKRLPDDKAPAAAASEPAKGDVQVQADPGTKGAAEAPTKHAGSRTK